MRSNFLRLISTVMGVCMEKSEIGTGLRRRCCQRENGAGEEELEGRGRWRVPLQPEWSGLDCARAAGPGQVMYPILSRPEFPFV